MPISDLCPGDSLLLSASVNNHGIPGNISAWSGPGVQNSVFYASLAGPGTHTLSISYGYANAPSCSVTETIMITVDNIPQPTISYNNLVLTCNQAGFNYLWTLNGNPAPGVNNQQTYNVQSNGSYRVQLGTAACNLWSDSIDVMDVSLNELKSVWNWMLYPNPSQGLVTVEFDNPGISSIRGEILDQSGRLIRSIHRSVNGRKIVLALNLKDLASGVYQIRIHAGDLQFTEGILLSPR